MFQRPRPFIRCLLLTSKNHGDSSLGSEFDHNIRTLVGDPDVVLRINFYRVGIRPCIEVVANLPQKFPISAGLQQLGRGRSICGSCRIGAREHEDLAFRIYSYPRNFAKIDIGWEAQEIRHRTVLNFGHPSRLCRKRTGLRRNCRQKENCREPHFYSSLRDPVRESDLEMPYRPREESWSNIAHIGQNPRFGLVGRLTRGLCTGRVTGMTSA